MAIPDFQTLIRPILETLSDKTNHPRKEIIDTIAEHFQLSDAERDQRLPSGRQRVLDNRVDWATAYLTQSRCIEKPSRGVLLITQRGLEVLTSGLERIDHAYLSQFPEFQKYTSSAGISQKSKTGFPEDEISKKLDQTPEEILEASYEQIRKELTQEVITRVMQCPPDFFERLVVDLLVAMGYGGSIADAGKAIGRTGDDGIDGIIKEDRLGLDFIAIQAKRWQKTVGRPIIQAFVGSLAGNRAKKGVFITTSSFSNEAREYVTRIEQKVVLIDGKILADLMIAHNVGVSAHTCYTIKKIDLDYFEGV